jgi:hypothetical protein
MPAALGPPSLHAPFLLLPPPQAEAEQRAKAKEDLKAFLLSNEVNKKVGPAEQGPPAMTAHAVLEG